MVSIIIPVYNAEPFLRQMLDSVLGQSYKDYEIILINDGSKDESGNVCREYSEKYSCIKYYDRENHGVSATRNFGLDRASGDFVWFMDSDDILAEGALKVAVDTQKQYNADIVIGGMNFCFAERSKIIAKTIDNELFFCGSDFAEYYVELYSNNYISPLWNKLIRRSVITDNNVRMLEKLEMYEDYVFSMDVLVKCNSVACVPDILYDYQIRDGQSLSRRYKPDVADMLRMFKNKISSYRELIANDNSNVDIHLNNLVIYFAYECIKNQARNKSNALESIKDLLNDKAFEEAMMTFKGYGIRYVAVYNMMKNKRAFLLLAYLRALNKS